MSPGSCSPPLPAIKPFWDPHLTEFVRYQHQQSLPAPSSTSNAPLTKKGKLQQGGFCQRCGAPRTGAAVATIDKRNPKFCSDGASIKFYSLPHPQPDGLWAKGKFSAGMYARLLGAMAQGKDVSANFKVFTSKHTMSVQDPEQKDWARKEGM